VDTLALYRMEIQPAAGQSPEECAAGICIHFSKFVVDYYRSQRREVFPLHFDGRADHPDNGHTVVAARYVCGQHTLATVDWQIMHPEDRYWAWSISFACATDRHRVELQYRTEIGLRTLLVTPGKFNMTVQLGLIMPANFIGSVLALRTATVDGWPIPVATAFLEPNDVDKFVDRILLDPNRVLPVIMLAADGRFKSTPASMQDLQYQLLGAAHLAALTNPAASERLAGRLGPNLACSEGVLRIYYPMLTLQSSSRDHPVLHAQDLQGKKLEATLHMRAMKHLLQRVPDGPVTGAARAAVCGELAKYGEQLPSVLTRLANAEEKLRTTEGQRDRLRAERDEARQSRRAAEGKLAEQLRMTGDSAGELGMTQAKLAAIEEELGKVRAERAETLEVLHDREQYLAQSEHHLNVLRSQLAVGNVTEADAGELERELDRAWRENGHTVEELETARQQIVTLTAELAVCKKNLKIVAAESVERRPFPEIEPVVSAASELPTSVIEALKLASERHGDILEIWDDAWKSAEASHFAGPTRVMEALTAIAEVGRNYFAALREGRSLGPLDQAFQQKIPFKYAPCEGQMTMAMYGRERLFHHGGQHREIQRHLTLGGGGICLQVCFDFDEANHKVVVAHCGQHLSYYRQA
jgi:hypothetical protein